MPIHVEPFHVSMTAGSQPLSQIVIIEEARESSSQCDLIARGDEQPRYFALNQVAIAAQGRCNHRPAPGLRLTDDSVHHLVPERGHNNNAVRAVLLLNLLVRKASEDADAPVVCGEFL